ncbi:MAG: damage-inducible protein DinB [Acidobacteria bacterium]|nr:MAG: damage-inducible protein DinB [Acidobacteriota bacterium]PYY03861.1 MAG: damage-inducible protein DinB [Acidobacteriota bacterium]PYY22424.1 MAG: damage-inducible protein DinB [Acidobacteriota bacterium]
MLGNPVHCRNFHHTDWEGQEDELSPTIAYFKELYAYNTWANDRAFDAAEPLHADLLKRDLGNSFGSLHDTFTHIVGAEWIWLERWFGRWPPALLQPSEFSDRKALRSKLNQVRLDREKWISTLPEKTLGADMRYRNLRGEFYSYPLWQQLAHVVNHSTYHRGQVTTMLRQLGAAAVSTDLLLYYDEHNKQRS